MTHERNKYKQKYLNTKDAIWKLQDDYTGFSVYSNEVTFDYQGFVTKRGQEDPLPPDMWPQVTIKEMPPPFIRPIDNSKFTDHAIEDSIVWDEYNSTWDSSTYEY